MGYYKNKLSKIVIFINKYFDVPGTIDYPPCSIIDLYDNYIAVMKCPNILNECGSSHNFIDRALDHHSFGKFRNDPAPFSSLFFFISALVQITH